MIWTALNRLDILVKHRPWFKFQPSSWLNDPELRACNAAARALLIDLMCIAHQSTPYGYFRPDDTEESLKTLSKTLGVDRRSLVNSLNTLGKYRRIIRDSRGAWYIKRMVQDAKAHRIASAHGKRGGNPALKASDKADKTREEKSREDTAATLPATPAAQHSKDICEAIGMLRQHGIDSDFGRTTLWRIRGQYGPDTEDHVRRQAQEEPA